MFNISAKCNILLEPFVGRFKGIMLATELIKDVQRQLGDTGISEAAWDLAHTKLSDNDTAALQVYWVDTQLRDRRPSPQGPEWKAQSLRACLPASLGLQRYPGNSKRGLDLLLCPGLGKQRHLEAALQLPSPFRPGQAVDDDIEFCARALAVMGPHLAQKFTYISKSPPLEAIQDPSLEK